MEDNKTKEEIPQWILDYDKQNHQSSAGKAIRILLQSTKQLQDKYDALEMVLIKMMQFVPVDERDLFLHTLSTEELRRVEVAEIVAMLNTKS